MQRQLVTGQQLEGLEEEQEGPSHAAAGVDAMAAGFITVDLLGPESAASVDLKAAVAGTGTEAALDLGVVAFVLPADVGVGWWQHRTAW